LPDDAFRCLRYSRMAKAKEIKYMSEFNQLVRQGMAVRLLLIKQPIMLRSVIGDRQFMVKWASNITAELLHGLLHLEEKRLVLQSI
jgi:hypothetical protein